MIETAELPDGWWEAKTASHPLMRVEARTEGLSERILRTTLEWWLERRVKRTQLEIVGRLADVIRPENFVRNDLVGDAASSGYVYHPYDFMQNGNDGKGLG